MFDSNGTIQTEKLDPMIRSQNNNTYEPCNKFHKVFALND